MKSSSFNGCKVYNLSSGKTIPEWISNTKKRALAKDVEYSRRLELIQDFEMTTAAQCIRMTNDHEHIIVTGVYPPLIRCYTTSDMAMKFQRGLTCDIIAMQTLSDDFGKLVFLQSDRTLSFHAPYGSHYSLRVPKFGRDLSYNTNNCDLYVSASGNEIYRLNLETGQFKEPFALSYDGCNKISQNIVHHNLVAYGGEGGHCEFWDVRARKAVSKMNSNVNNDVYNYQYASGDKSHEITAMKFDSDGLTFGLGTYGGVCSIYDIRSKKPLHVKEHQYGVPIVDISYHNSSRHIITTDKKIIKIWEREESHMGKITTNIETPADINDILQVNDQRGETGLLMVAGEQSRIMTYFIPQLGPAPRWCSFLDSLTEELEENSSGGGEQHNVIYDDYKFLTLKEVEDLGATGLLGTPMLKGYMHGFFIEMKLYSKLRAVSKPFEYEEHRKKLIRDKIAAKRQSRITPLKRLPKVNKALAEKYMRRDGLVDGKSNNKKNNNNDDGDVDDHNVDEGSGGGGVKKSTKSKITPLIDERFAKLFENEEFEVDENDIEYKLHNPTKSNKKGDLRGGSRRKGYADGGDSDDELADLYDPVDDGVDDAADVYDQEDEEGDEGDYDDDEDDDLEKIDARKQYDFDGDADEDFRRRSSKKRSNNSIHKSNHLDDDDDEEEEGQIFKASRRIESRQQKSLQVSSKQPAANKRMYELNDSISSSQAVFGHTKLAKEKRQHDRQLSQIPLQQRVNHDHRDKPANISSNSTSGSSSSAKGPLTKYHNSKNGADNRHSHNNDVNIRYVKTEGEGLMREISFYPKDNGERGTNRREDHDYGDKEDKMRKSKEERGRINKSQRRFKPSDSFSRRK